MTVIAGDGIFLTQTYKENKMSMMSENVDQLFTALAKAQAEFTVAEYNKTNPHFKSKFADLQSYFAASRAPLAKNGLCVIQTISEQEGKPVLITLLAHASGQWIKSVMHINATKNDMQGFGSALSYSKRYSLGAILGLASGEEDDDGTEAVEEAKYVAKPAPYIAPVSKPEPKPKPPEECITKEQLTEFEIYWKQCSEEHRKTYTKILVNAPNNAKSLAEMPKNIYEKFLELAKINAQLMQHKKDKEKENGQDTDHE